MASSCSTCGKGLSLTQRARGRTMCDDCAARRKVALTQALGSYEEALVAAATDPRGSAFRLREVERAIAEYGGDTRSTKDLFYRRLLDRALADEVLTAEEESHLDDVGSTLYADDADDHVEILREYRARIFIASVNADRLPSSTESTTVMLKRGELMHLAEPARLLKEVVHKEWQSGSRGYSFRIMKGVSYRVGNTRGKMVEVGRSLEAVDAGPLSITSQRAVFTGERRSIEMPYAKLLDLNVYTDAIQFHLSGRANPPVFGVSDGPMVAAAINAAMQRTLT